MLKKNVGGRNPNEEIQKNVDGGNPKKDTEEMLTEEILTKYKGKT